MAAIMADDDIEVRQALVAKCGDKQVILDHITVNGIPFIKLTKQNVQLGKLCNALQDKKYFRGADIFSYLLQKRNSEVNKLIKLAAFADDPFAEIGQADDQDGMLGASRNELFTKYKIPEVIKLSIPAFKNHAAVQIHVLATSKLAASIYMEASGVNLKWFKTACCHAWLEAADEHSSPKKRNVDIGQLQVEASKVIKLKANTATKIEMYCNYKQGSGRWSKKHMSTQ